MRSDLFAMAVLALIVSMGTVSFHRLAHGQALNTGSSRQAPDDAGPPPAGDRQWSAEQIRRYEDEDEDTDE